MGEDESPAVTAPASNSHQAHPPAVATTGSRVAAAASLLVLAGTLALLIAFTLSNFGYLVAALIGVGLAVSALWVTVTNRRWRWLALIVVVASVAGAVVALVAASLGVLIPVLVLSGMSLSGLLGAMALRDEIRPLTTGRWRTVPKAVHPVLLMNPKSGGGKVEHTHLEAEAGHRGIESVVLDRGDDLRALAEAAVARGADVLGMAGGDGSQALVASVAAAHGLAYVCVPAGTRNHLALDLGIDRDDVVGALDAFGPAHERTIDLASVNGQTFVNNVSLGVYAEVVASSEYRDAKMETVTAMLPDLLGGESAFDLHLTGPDGPIRAPQIVQVSNNPYRFTSLAGFGSRPRIDGAVLGVATVRVDGPIDANRLVALEAVGQVERYRGWKSWAVPQLEVNSTAPVPAGIDGESCTLTPPLRFAIDPGALRVRMAFGQSGASPAMAHPPLSASTVVGLWRLAFGRQSGGVL